MLGIGKLFKNYRKRRKFAKAMGELDILLHVADTHCRPNILGKREGCRIAFVMPGMARYAGGYTSILRLGTYLSAFGHHVSYVSFDGSSKEDMERNALTNLPDYRGEICESAALKDARFDIGIATSWMTCYHLLAHQDNFDYKAYFVQDFEPSFFPLGEHYLMALNTYRAGLHMISLGGWNKRKIEEALPGVEVDRVDFPVELKEYPLVRRNVRISDEIRLAVYLKLDGKRAPHLLCQQLRYLQERFSGSPYRVEIDIFGIEKEMVLPVGNNLGKLSHEGLRRLYGSHHFGVVASLTNISLVNFEMIASGLPVIDFIDGSAPAFFSPDEMIFVEATPRSLYDKISHFVENQQELNAMLARAQEKLHAITWEKVAAQFAGLAGIAAAGQPEAAPARSGGGPEVQGTGVTAVEEP